MAYRDRYDDDDYGYADPLSGLGASQGLDGLGGASYNDDLALGAYNSGLDGLGGAYGSSGLDGYGSAAYNDLLAGGLGGLSLNTDLHGYNTGLGGSGLDGLGSGLGGLDSGYGGLGSGLSGEFGIPETDLDYMGSGLLNDPAYDLNDSGLGMGYGAGLGGAGSLGGLDSGLEGLGLGSRGFDDGLGGMGGYGGLGSGYDSLGSGLDGLGTAGLVGGLDGMGGLSSGLGNGLDGYGAGMSGLDGLGSGLGGLGGAGMGDLGLDGLGSSYTSNYDLGFDYDNIGSGLDSLGWSSYDSGLDGLGDAALLAGGAGLAGAALGAGAARYLGHRGHDHGYGGSSYYGSSMYDPGLGILGSTNFGWGAYDGMGYGSNIGSPSLRYSDLANFENRLFADQAIGQAERQSIMADRMAWEALDDSARLAQYNSWDDGYRSRMGLNTGYWGQRYNSGYGSSLYDPMYAAQGWASPQYSNYSGYDYAYGYGAPSFYSTSLSSLPYSVTAPVRNYYGSYMNSWDSNSLPYWSDDSRWREAADLTYYQRRLSADTALSESERMRRWQQRLEWEALDQESRRLQWASMAETQRERLGLGLIGSYYGSRYGSRGIGMSLPFELPSNLRSYYSPYLPGQGLATTSYMDGNYARYNDLMTWANALQYDRSISDADRRARWQRRMEWEQLDEAERRLRWNRMPYKDRALTGLSGGFWDSRYGLNDFYDPRRLRPMKFPVSRTLAGMFKPFQSKAYLAQALRQGQEEAVAFADLVAFENALRADRRLRTEDKLRRWRARIRWQEMNERERRLRFFQMQEAERRMLGLGLSSFFGRRYSAPLLLNGVRGLPPPRTRLPYLRTALPETLKPVYAPIMARQPVLANTNPVVMGNAIMGRPQQRLLATSELSRSNAVPDRAKDLADRIRLSLAQKAESSAGLSTTQRLAATEQKRRILREMDDDRANNTNIIMSDEERIRRLRSMGY